MINYLDSKIKSLITLFSKTFLVLNAMLFFQLFKGFSCKGKFSLRRRLEG